MRTYRLPLGVSAWVVGAAAWVLAFSAGAAAQGPPPGGPGRGPRPLPPPEAPGVLTHVPSEAAGDQGVAVRVLAPPAPRYPAGAPVAIHVAGGVSAGGTVGRPEYAPLGFVEVRFAFPGGEGEAASGGSYDYRGPKCHRALADVIRFATGRATDRQGRRIGDLAPGLTVLTRNCGLVGFSHGGNACGLAMARHGEEFPDLAWYASMESPYGEGAVNVELGGFGQGVNPAYDPQSGRLDLTKLAWSADLAPAPTGRAERQAAGLQGALYFDLNGDGRFAPGEDFPVNAFIGDAGQGAKVYYSPRLIAEAERRRLPGATWPGHLPTLDESRRFWRDRDAAESIPEAVRKCPQAAVIVYAGERDHVQSAPDHPHILAQVEGFRAAGARFVRLNPDRAYVERLLAGRPPALARPDAAFPDNAAGATWTRQNIRGGLEPEGLPIPLFMQAAVCELADRTQAGNWSANLDAVLYPDAPWLAGRETPGREPGREGRPPAAGPVPQRPAGVPGLPPTGSPGPWDRDVIAYHVGTDGAVERLATFERAGVPTIARLKDGRLIVAHQHFPENDAANFDKVAVRFSSDDGRTWTPPQVIRLAGLPEGMRFPFDPTLVPLPDGRVRLYFTSLRGRRFEEDVPAIYSAVSADGVDYTFEPGVRFGVDGRVVIDCAVVLHAGVFHLYAPDNGPPRRPGERPGERADDRSGDRPGPAEGPADARPREGAGYHATSRDGLAFTRAEDVRVEGRRRWLGNAQSDGRVITFFGTGDPAPSEGGPPRGSLWMATSADGQAWRLAPSPAVTGGDPGGVAAKAGGWIVVITGEPRPGTPGDQQRRPQPGPREPGPGPRR